MKEEEGEGRREGGEGGREVKMHDKVGVKIITG